MSLFPMFFLVSLYLQAVLGHEAVLGGLALLPLCVVVIAVASLADRLIGRFGLRGVMAAGFVLVRRHGMAGLSRISADGSFVSDVLPPTLVLGVALPLVSITTNVAATLDTREDEAGLASGLVNTSLQFGSVIGLAVLSGVAAARTNASDAPHEVALTQGFGAAFLLGAGLAVAGALLSLRLRLPGPPVPEAPDAVGQRRAVP
ncbi:MFS transporter OS=Streptomyces tendae OX=1932 GN=F3L20_25095 PE=4 SV=1 [Streptomyces tendae]